MTRKKQEKPIDLAASEFIIVTKMYKSLGRVSCSNHKTNMHHQYALFAVHFLTRFNSFKIWLFPPLNISILQKSLKYKRVILKSQTAKTKKICQNSKKHNNMEKKKGNPNRTHWEILPTEEDSQTSGPKKHNPQISAYSQNLAYSQASSLMQLQEASRNALSCRITN